MAVASYTMSQLTGSGKLNSQMFSTKGAADRYLKRSGGTGTVVKVLTNSTPHKKVGYTVMWGRKSNPHATKFPKGKFVKVQAVRVNRDGTITVKK